MADTSQGWAQPRLFAPPRSLMTSASGAWRVGWRAAWSVGRDLAIDEDSVAAAAE
jgi:hypothetical protein